MSSKKESLTLSATIPLEERESEVEGSHHGKLLQAFNGAHSIAQQFFVGVLDQLTAIATKAASGAIVGGLLSFIPGAGIFAELFRKFTGFAGGGIIPEPVLGIGLRSGAGYTFGEQGPEYVIPHNTRIPLPEQAQHPMLAMAA